MTLNFQLDRTIRTPLTEQIQRSITKAIESGVLSPGARLPSWVDLAAQLGVSRGTVRAAYEMLMDAQLVVASRSAGTRVSDRPAILLKETIQPPDTGFMELYKEFTAGPAIFQLGVPAHETVPAKLFSQIRSHAMHSERRGSALYPDPRGEFELRRVIAAYLAIARGIECLPSQIIITNGFAGGLGLALQALDLRGRSAWIEDPCFPFSRKGLELAGLKPIAIPVDSEGLDVEQARKLESDVALALLTPGQQAPLGMTLSLARRLSLLRWATESGGWIIEDDYLSELQLESRAASALASLDRDGRVIHIGSFSKTLSPTIRLGFVVAPPTLAPRLSEIATCLSPAPGPAVQLATAKFIHQGHYLRHLRRAKRLYCTQRDELLKTIANSDVRAEISTAGLAVLLKLPTGSPDLKIAREASIFGMSPGALSPWYSCPERAEAALMLRITTSSNRHLKVSCDRLSELIRRHT
ncbi:MocR-like pyridoxine biosynthesis transcription factor PdxR [Pseudomonas reactans]|uniref:MocR-like pyridoxine biosynthesis transcription factor PdxR n=1 Tax=Pseudomonas reactans TaxID=117680 RepID=UPI00159FE1AA|nr:PLP-dependent aminotransferase family protein [Pseudomonas reactans]NWC88158.1 PLP-dependent aminotransferase family protein [Pseudomonas reactans]